MAIDLTGKPMAITGASSGIGKATAIACAKAGMPVALGARRMDKLEAVAEEIRKIGGIATAIQLDVTSVDQCRAFIEKTEAEFGALYAVFANAGYGFERPIHETTDDDVREIFEANFFGTLNTIQPAVERFIERRMGHVLICSSSIGKMAIPGYGAYCATKAAQWHVGRAMRHELKPLGIHVSTIHPIGTRTEFSQEVRRRSGGTDVISNTPKTFIQPPDRVAKAVVACLKRPRTEVWTSLTGRLGLGCLSMFPWFADMAFDRLAGRD